MSRTASDGSEAMMAAQNALTLGTSLAMTGSIALIIRLLVPRFLGPTAFGEYRVAESLAEVLFVLLTFGIDAQMRREAATDPSRARGYLIGLTVLRLAVGAVAIGAAIACLRATGAGPTVVALFVLIAIGQVLIVLNNSYAAFEHAAGEVSWIARTSFAVKVIWAAAMMAVLTWTPTGIAVAAAALGIEALRFAWLTARGFRRHRIAVRPDLRLAAGAVAASFPLFVNLIAHSLYARVGTGWLAAFCGDHEIGLYGAASNLASIALLGMPLMSWVLVPSTARAASRSEGEMGELVSGALRVSLLVVVPLAVAFYVGAEFWLQLLFGPEYREAAAILRVLAPTFALTYASTVCAIALIQSGRVWTVAGVSLAGVVVTMGLDMVLVPWGIASLGPAGGAQGAAWGTLVTEVLVATALAWCSRDRWIDARLVRTAAALGAGAAVAVLAVHAATPPAGLAGLAAGLAASGALALAAIGAGGAGRDDLRFCRQVLARTGR